MRTGWTTIAAALLATVGAAGTAQAGPEPFFGYSPYFGGPAAYFTYDEDVRQASIISPSLPGYGTRTYYRGGPFWTYQSNAVERAYYPRTKRRAVVLRRKG